jgi:exopolyphosphatase/guanosine-5'-triphosphate,3'-diphosphate pyrophosphatase
MSIDIGGGSTEFSIINKKEISSNISLDLGTMRLKELFFDKNDIEGAKRYIDGLLVALDGVDPKSIIGIGGSFRAISSAILNRSSYPLQKLHAFEPNYDEFVEFLKEILTFDEDDLKRSGIKNSRVDVIKPAALILLRILKKFKVKDLTTSGVGVREGVFLTDLLRTSRDRFPPNFNPSMRYILDSHTESLSYANQISKVAKDLFDLTHETLGIDKKYRYELSIAAKLYTSGSSIHYYSLNRHSYYLIEDALEFGFTHKEIILIATLTRYAKRKLPSPRHIEKFRDLLPQTAQLNALSYLLSLSVALLSHRPRNIDFTLAFEDLQIKVESKNSLYLAKESIEKLEMIKEKELKIIFS